MPRPVRLVSGPAPDSADGAAVPTGDGPSPASQPGPGDLTRVTVNLTPRAVAALDVLAAAGPQSKTDAINRALRTAGRLVRHVDSGGVVVLVVNGRHVEIEVV